MSLGAAAKPPPTDEETGLGATSSSEKGPLPIAEEWDWDWDGFKVCVNSVHSMTLPFSCTSLLVGFEVFSAPEFVSFSCLALAGHVLIKNHMSLLQMAPM